uniref:Reverse transcriptase n=1 Tax=Cannabis sativa TaxID=3483 RepID=A0A803PV21_CANSA
MASSSKQGDDLVDRYEQIQLEEEEEGVLITGENEEEEQAFDDRWCLVGKFLTGRTIDFDAMRHMMASLWQPGRGVYIKELDTNRYLFQFYHEIDIQAVIDGSPWTFNRIQLVFHRLKRGEDPRLIRLHKLDMWIQLHDLKYGFMSDWVVKHVGNYIGTHKKLIKPNGDWIWTTFKYEHAPMFCFICGLIGHSEIFCPKRFEEHFDDSIRMYGEWMKAPTRKKNYLIGAQWLRTGREEEEGAADGGDRSRSMRVERVINDSAVIGIDRENYGGDHGMRMEAAQRNRQSEKFVEVNAKESKDQDSHEEASVISQSEKETMLILETKRRRTETNEQRISRVVDDTMVDNVDEVNYSQKNEVQETIEKLRIAINFAGAFSVDAQGKSGGVALLWRVEGDVNLLGFGQNYIDASVMGGNKGNWRLTGLYGEPNRSLRRNTWTLMKILRNRSTLPWCIVGDLNNVTSQSDKRGGNPYPNWLVDGFCETLDACGLVDLELNGYPFTWEKGRGTNAWIEVRIDRAVVSQNWLDLFPIAKLLNLEVSTSDHCPLLLMLDNVIQVVAIRSFKFENSWLREPMCLQIVKETWESSGACPITQKLQHCGEKLKAWGSDFSGNFKKRIKECKADLRCWKKGRDPVAIQKYKEAEVKLQEVLLQREIFWRQRSKQLWLREGDQNSKYFHAMASSRRRNNSIHKLRREDGTWSDWESDLPHVMTDYFQNLFTSSSADCVEVVNSIPQVVSNEQNFYLQQLITDEEVKKALFQMHPDKSPGPDGMTPGFFQKFWHVVSSDVINHVRGFFDSGSFCTELNETNIVLVPKKKHPESMSDLRPISLCNVIYKVISKVLANRIKGILPSVISENQSAFLEGRLISDNIMISFEIMHYLKRKRMGKEGYMALKLDLSKAYDRVEWAFLEQMMLHMGFNQKIVSLIMHCVSTVKYSITHGSHGVSWMSWQRLSRHKDVGGLGFRNLRDYNMAFLGKQGWRLVTNDNSLVAKIYKARHYSNGSFFSAELGPNRSFIWRSLWEAKSLVRMGARKAIGDGKSTMILNEPWLPGTGCNFITTSHPNLVGRTVDSLMKMEEKVWDEELIYDMFTEEESMRILAIQLGDSAAVDTWSWSEEKSGVYSVSSGYKLLQQQSGAWPCTGAETCWQKLWQMQVPAKVHHLVWRAMSGCLPTKVQLTTKHVHVDLTCPLCNVEVESIAHVLLHCPFARSCWNISMVGYNGEAATDFFSWFGDLLAKNQQSVVEEAAMVAWRIWLARNDILWNNKSTKALDVVKLARTNLVSWRNAQNQKSEALLNVNYSKDLEHWRKPIVHKYKINVDGAIFEAENCFGVGIIIRDQAGYLVEAVSTRKIGVVTPEIAEVIGVKEALSWIKNHDLSDVEIESDSLVVVQAINGEVQMPSQFGMIVQDCRLMISTLNNVLISFVKRSANKAAHCVARKSCFLSGCIFSELNAPSDLLSIVMDERSG